MRHTTPDMLSLFPVTNSKGEKMISKAVTTVLLAGAVLIFTVGFAQGSGGVFHNATHDTRHAVTFPCH